MLKAFSCETVTLVAAPDVAVAADQGGYRPPDLPGWAARVDYAAGERVGGLLAADRRDMFRLDLPEIR